MSSLYIQPPWSRGAGAGAERSAEPLAQHGPRLGADPAHPAGGGKAIGRCQGPKAGSHRREAEKKAGPGGSIAKKVFVFVFAIMKLSQLGASTVSFGYGFRNARRIYLIKTCRLNMEQYLSTLVSVYLRCGLGVPAVFWGFGRCAILGFAALNHWAQGTRHLKGGCCLLIALHPSPFS